MSEYVYKKMSKLNIGKYEYLSKQKFKYFSIPKIEKIDDDGIFFEKIDNYTKLSDIIKKGSCPDDLLFRIGQVLGEIHGKLGNTKFVLHGDFWAGNVLLKNDLIYVIDFEEYEGYDSLSLSSDIMKNPLWDISMFLFHAKYDLSIYNFYRLFNRKNIYLSSFLNGYVAETGMKIDKKNIDKMIYKHIMNMINIKRENKIKENLKVIVWKIIYRFF